MARALRAVPAAVPTVTKHIGRSFTGLGCEDRTQIAICVHDVGTG